MKTMWTAPRLVILTTAGDSEGKVHPVAFEDGPPYGPS